MHCLLGRDRGTWLFRGWLETLPRLEARLGHERVQDLQHSRSVICLYKFERMEMQDKTYRPNEPQRAQLGACTCCHFCCFFSLILSLLFMPALDEPEKAGRLGMQTPGVEFPEHTPEPLYRLASPCRLCGGTHCIAGPATARVHNQAFHGCCLDVNSPQTTRLKLCGSPTFNHRPSPTAITNQPHHPIASRCRPATPAARPLSHR